MIKFNNVYSLTYKYKNLPFFSNGKGFCTIQARKSAFGEMCERFMTRNYFEDYFLANLYPDSKRGDFLTPELKKFYQIDSLEKESGKKFYSTTHQLIKDRNKLIITKLNEEENEPVFFDENIVEIKEPISFTLKVQSRASYKISRNPNVAALDYDKLKFPLQLRKWKSGDFFMPLGMNRMKKLSDFFIDNKWSLVDKQNAFLIQSGNDIVCILGHRIDERYKITEDTTKLFIIEKATNKIE